MTRVIYALNYNRCSVKEVRGFVLARTGHEPPPMNHRSDNIRLLERLDAEAKFVHFAELPPELRIWVYSIIFRDPAQNTSILRTSKGICIEARAVMYQVRPVYARALVYTTGSNQQIGDVSFWSSIGCLDFRHTQIDQTKARPLRVGEGDYCLLVQARWMHVRRLYLTFTGRYLGFLSWGPWPSEALRVYLQLLSELCPNLHTLHLEIPGMQAHRRRDYVLFRIAISPLDLFNRDIKLFLSGRHTRRQGHWHMRHDAVQAMRTRLGDQWLEGFLARVWRFMP